MVCTAELALVLVKCQLGSYNCLLIKGCFPSVKACTHWQLADVVIVVRDGPIVAPTAQLPVQLQHCLFHRHAWAGDRISLRRVAPCDWLGGFHPGMIDGLIDC